MFNKKSNVIKLQVLLITGMMSVIPQTVFAFKQHFHEDITESILKGKGFDEDSADQVGDANCIPTYLNLMWMLPTLIVIPLVMLQ